MRSVMAPPASDVGPHNVSFDIDNALQIHSSIVAHYRSFLDPSVCPALERSRESEPDRSTSHGADHKATPTVTGVRPAPTQRQATPAPIVPEPVRRAPVGVPPKGVSPGPSRGQHAQAANVHATPGSAARRAPETTPTPLHHDVRHTHRDRRASAGHVGGGKAVQPTTTTTTSQATARQRDTIRQGIDAALVDAYVAALTDDILLIDNASVYARDSLDAFHGPGFGVHGPVQRHRSSDGTLPLFKGTLRADMASPRTWAEWLAMVAVASVVATVLAAQQFRRTHAPTH